MDYTNDPTRSDGLGNNLHPNATISKNSIRRMRTRIGRPVAAGAEAAAVGAVCKASREMRASGAGS